MGGCTRPRLTHCFFPLSYGVFFAGLWAFGERRCPGMLHLVVCFRLGMFRSLKTALHRSLGNPYIMWVGAWDVSQ